MEWENENVWLPNFFSSGPIWTYEVCASSYEPYALRCTRQNIIGPHRKKSVSQNNLPEGGALGDRGQGVTSVKIDQNRSGQKIPGHLGHAESGYTVENNIEALVPKRKVIGDPDSSLAWMAGTRPAAARGFTAGGPKHTGLVLKAACGRMVP